MSALERLLGLYTDAGQAMPEAIGAANVRDPLAKLLMGTVEGMATLPRRAMQSSETMRTTGVYDPAPMVEAAMTVAGAPLVGGIPKGSVGSGFADLLHHGSPQRGIRVLNESERGPLGPGVYASPFEGTASRYAGDGGAMYTLPQKERDIFNGLGDRYGSGYEGWKSDKARLLAAAEPDKRAALAEILDKTWMSDGYPMYARIRGIYGGHEGAQSLFKRAGFEGLSGHVDGPEVVLFGKQPL